MKFDVDKKHPFTSVTLIPEDEGDERLSEEQTARLKKIALRCVYLLYACVVFAVFALLCELVGGLTALKEAGAARVLAVIGYVGLGCLIVTLVLLFREGRNVQKLADELKKEDGGETSQPSAND